MKIFYSILALIVSLAIGFALGFITTNMNTTFQNGQQNVIDSISRTLQATGELPVNFNDQRIILAPKQNAKTDD